jgi:hypothetical protein
MIASFIGNTKFQFNPETTKNLRDTNKIKTLKIEHEDVFEKIRNFNPDSCYDFSGLDESNSDGSQTANVTLKTIYNNINSFTEDEKLLKNNKEYHKVRFTQILEKQGSLGKKLIKLKNIIKIMDVFVSIMIIAGCIISQMEYEDYFFSNLTDRTQTLLLISDLHYNNGNLSAIDLKNYNISYLSNETFVKLLNFSDYENLPIPMPISQLGEKLRFIILALTFLSLPFIVLGRYIEFIRDYVYIKKFEGKIQLIFRKIY